MKIRRQGTLSREPGRGAYMPSMSRLRDGGLVACQHVGEALSSPDNHIEFLRDSGDGRWARVGAVHEPDGQWAYRAPDVQELPDGRLVLSATRFKSDGRQLFDPDSEALQRAEIVLFRSSDRGATWSPPQPVPVPLSAERYTWNQAGRLVLLSPTRWMLPFETWKPAGVEGPPDQKAAAVFSADEGQTWGEMTVIADDPTGTLLWWDQMNARLVDGRLYVMLWTHRYGTKEDLAVHWVTSHDEGRTWSSPCSTNLPGQVCCPIALPDGRVGAVYNHRKEPQGVRFAVSADLTTFDRESELVVFDAGSEASFGETDHENFLAEHLLIAFGKPQGIFLADSGTVLLCFWCTVEGVTHTRWVEVEV